MSKNTKLSLVFRFKMKEENKWKEVNLNKANPENPFAKVVGEAAKELQLNPRKLLITNEKGYLIHPKKYRKSIASVVEDFGKIFIMHFKDEYLKKLKSGFMPVGNGSVQQLEAELTGEQLAFKRYYEKFEPPF